MAAPSCPGWIESAHPLANMRFTLSLSFTIILIFVDLVPATCSGNLFGLVQSEHSQRWLENAIESMKEVQHYV